MERVFLEGGHRPRGPRRGENAGSLHTPGLAELAEHMHGTNRARPGTNRAFGGTNQARVGMNQPGTGCSSKPNAVRRGVAPAKGRPQKARLWRWARSRPARPVAASVSVPGSGTAVTVTKLLRIDAQRHFENRPYRTGKRPAGHR